jgi:hypothetical protein
MRRIVPSGCWEWAGAKNKEGYGHFRMSGKVMLAHRCSYLLLTGDIPEGMIVMHSCDNPSCVNPEHLRAGTHADNMADRNFKGRASGGSLKGGRHPGAKLTASDIKSIRSLCGRGIPQSKIAARFNISQPTVCNINRRKSWSHHV